MVKTTAAASAAGLTATQQTVAGLVTSLSSSALSMILNISRGETEQIQKEVKDFQTKSQLIKPGEKYTVKGTLSLTLKYYVMNDKLQFDEIACYTGATADSEKVHPISEYFKKLDVRKGPQDRITVYSK